MSNMSYCRFQNTAMDLADCLDALENHWDMDLSTDEVNGLETLLADAKELVYMEDTVTHVIDRARKSLNHREL